MASIGRSGKKKGDEMTDDGSHGRSKRSASHGSGSEKRSKQHRSNSSSVGDGGDNSQEMVYSLLHDSLAPGGSVVDDPSASASAHNPHSSVVGGSASAHQQPPPPTGPTGPTDHNDMTEGLFSVTSSDFSQIPILHSQDPNGQPGAQSVRAPVSVSSVGVVPGQHHSEEEEHSIFAGVHGVGVESMITPSAIQRRYLRWDSQESNQLALILARAIQASDVLQATHGNVRACWAKALAHFNQAIALHFPQTPSCARHQTIKEHWTKQLARFRAHKREEQLLLSSGGGAGPVNTSSPPLEGDTGENEYETLMAELSAIDLASRNRSQKSHKHGGMEPPPSPPDFSHPASPSMMLHQSVSRRLSPPIMSPIMPNVSSSSPPQSSGSSSSSGSASGSSQVSSVHSQYPPPILADPSMLSSIPLNSAIMPQQGMTPLSSDQLLLDSRFRFETEKIKLQREEMRHNVKKEKLDLERLRIQKEDERHADMMRKLSELLKAISDLRGGLQLPQ